MQGRSAIFEPPGTSISSRHSSFDQSSRIRPKSRLLQVFFTQKTAHTTPLTAVLPTTTHIDTADFIVLRYAVRIFATLLLLLMYHSISCSKFLKATEGREVVMKLVIDFVLAEHVAHVSLPSAWPLPHLHFSR